jgi:hypothetical protein
MQGTRKLRTQYPVTSSITSLVLRNAGVHGGLYPAAIASAPAFVFTPSFSSASRSSRSLSAMSDARMVPLKVTAAGRVVTPGRQVGYMDILASLPGVRLVTWMEYTGCLN